MKKSIWLASIGTAFYTLASFVPPPDQQLHFQVSVSKTNAAIGDTIELIFTAKLPELTHLYSEKTTCLPDEGPLLPQFHYSDSSGLYFDEGVLGVGDTMIEEPVFGCASGQFLSNVEFRQKIRITGPVGDFQVRFSGQICQDDGKCFFIKENIKIPSIRVSPLPDSSGKW